MSICKRFGEKPARGGSSNEVHCAYACRVGVSSWTQPSSHAGLRILMGFSPKLGAQEQVCCKKLRFDWLGRTFRGFADVTFRGMPNRCLASFLSQSSCDEPYAAQRAQTRR